MRVTVPTKRNWDLGKSTMSHHIVSFNKVFLGVILLLIAWDGGGFIGNRVCPGSISVNIIETLATKVSCSVTVMLAALILRRYLYNSSILACTCLVATEFIAFIVIMFFTRLWPLTIDDLLFNGRWLWRLTWNVVIAFVLGTVVGHLCQQWSFKVRL